MTVKDVYKKLEKLIEDGYGECNIAIPDKATDHEFYETNYVTIKTATKPDPEFFGVWADYWLNEETGDIVIVVID